MSSKPKHTKNPNADQKELIKTWDIIGETIAGSLKACNAKEFRIWKKAGGTYGMEVVPSNMKSEFESLQRLNKELITALEAILEWEPRQKDEPERIAYNLAHAVIKKTEGCCRE